MDSENKEIIEDNTSVEKVEKKVCADTKKVLSIFNSYIDENKTYALDEYKKFITLSYKDSLKKSKSKSRASEGEQSVKREPTKYNIFIREEMLKLKETNADIPYKELMKLAAKSWNEHKNN